MAKDWTLQSLIDDRMTVTAYCHRPSCHPRQALDLVKLRDRFGPDAPAMEQDIRPPAEMRQMPRQGWRPDLYTGQYPDRVRKSEGVVLRDSDLIERPCRGWTRWKDGAVDVEIKKTWWAARCLHFAKLNVSCWFDGSD
ncbi:hypothetical protein ACWTU9_32935, partial [Mesorhizobium sp. 128a]